MIHHDLNVDEAGRRVVDGILANVGGVMLGEFNDRFGRNSKDRAAMMDHLEPLAVEPRGGLKVIYTNTSIEDARGDASLIHTDPSGTRDVTPGPDVRVYHFTGTKHALGARPPSDTQTPAADPAGVDRALAAPARRGELRAAPPRVPREPRPVGHRGRSAPATAIAFAARMWDDWA